ncbi:lysophosphatidic acid receptor 2a [Denticeps clupeoides]|uniref:G-protein coupled receptors family 1 profile domain-containing protein n=1 Tax=Denticeps clupeoides TaxID=299321 RepID=A0AAY4B067_9TELE|nr:lysophosphatidic acid receptor 2-like [Denticeps clupeoides]
MYECHYDKPVAFFYNNSNKSITPDWRTQDYVIVSLGLVVCLIVVFSNLLVIAAIAINRHFHYPIYYLLGNMAGADLFAGMSYLYLLFHTGPYTIGLSVRQWFVRGALIDMSLTASVANLLALAVERHQTVFAMQLHSKMSNQRVLLLILGLWAVAVVTGLVPTMGWNCLCDLGTCSTAAPLYSRSFLVVWAVLNLLIFSVMVAMYARIFAYVRRNSRTMIPHTVDQGYSETLLSLMKTVVIILGAFVICWTPALVILLLDGLDCKACAILEYEKYCLVLAECNSLVNPIIYSFRDRDMRRTFKRILCCLFRSGEEQQEMIASAHFRTSQKGTIERSDSDARCRSLSRPLVSP